MDIAISDIKIGTRHRKEMGDIPALAASIESIGLLHPVVLRPDKRLVVGARRIAAYRHLGRDKIPARTASNLAELSDFLRAEADENTCRKHFDPVEGVGLAAAIRKAYKPKVEAAETEGRKAGGKKAGKGRPIDSSGVNCPKAKRDETARTSAVAAAAVGMSRRTLEQAEAVVASEDADLIASMIKTGKVSAAARKLKAKEELKAQQAAAKAAAPSNLWALTDEQGVVPCHALITDPPYGILDEPWEPNELEKFTRQWAKRWAKCGADFIAVFWSQRYLWPGRAWFDEAFSDHGFQQLLIWHYPNNKSPQSRMGFKQTWEPVFLYRKNGSEKEVRVGGGTWGESLNDFDCHVAAVPQGNFNGANRKQHPAQKPTGVMQWLVNALTRPGELVADPFCGSGTTGIAALQLGRRFHGIETDAAFVKIAKGRIVAYGKTGV